VEPIEGGVDNIGRKGGRDRRYKAGSPYTNYKKSACDNTVSRNAGTNKIGPAKNPVAKVPVVKAHKHKSAIETKKNVLHNICGVGSPEKSLSADHMLSKPDVKEGESRGEGLSAIPVPEDSKSPEGCTFN